MRALVGTDFQEISIIILKNFIRPLEFDVYVQRTFNVFTKIFRAGDPLDWQRVNLYKKKGIKYFFVKKNDYNKYTHLVDQLGELLTNSVGKFSRDQSLVILKELSRYVMHEIIENYDINPKTVSSAGVVVNGCINNLSKDPKSVAKMLQLMSNLPYILKHSTTVSIFAIILAQGLGIHDKKRLNAIGMGAFLHDIGVGQLTFDPEDEEHLTASQRKEMWRHPELGVQQLDGIQGIDRDILEIIRQHHEQPNGCGYPNGLKSDEISPLAKIVSIADTFSSLITKRIFRRALTLSEALEILKADKGKFDGSFIEAFATVLRKPFS